MYSLLPHFPCWDDAKRFTGRQDPATNCSCAHFHCQYKQKPLMSCFLSLTDSPWKQKVTDLLQVVPLSGCNQDHVDNLARLISERDAMSCFYHSQNTCCTMETGPVEVYIYMSSYQNFSAGYACSVCSVSGFLRHLLAFLVRQGAVSYTHLRAHETA